MTSQPPTHPAPGPTPPPTPPLTGLESGPDTVAGLLQAAQRLGLDRLDAQWLLAHRLQRPRSWVLAHGDATLAAPDTAAVHALLQQRAEGVPLAYLTGERGFHGLVLRVTPAVLDPRPDTETLVDWALDLRQGALAAVPAPRLLDLGTGSGAIALALGRAWPQAEMHASDLSPAALAVAQANGQRLGLPVQWHQGPWWRAVPDGLRWHLVLSNPPYIDGDDPHLPALRHEPRSALVPPDGDGLSALQTIVAGAPDRLHPGGWLLLEHGHTQGPAVAALLAAAGFAGIAHRHDLGGRLRCTGGRWPGG